MSNNNNNSSYGIGNFLYLLVCMTTAIVGYNIHNSIFWSIMDFFFAPIAIVKWLIFQEVNMTIIRESFAFFLK